MMLLEKIKKHSGKMMFFMLNIFVVATGVLFIKQKNMEEDMKKVTTASKEADLQNYKAVTDYAVEAQQRVKTEKEIKINSVASNSDSIQKQEIVSVTKTIPAVTKTVTVTQPAKESSSSKSSSSSTSTKTAPAPAKTTTQTS